VSPATVADAPQGRTWLRVLRWTLAALLITALALIVLAIPLTVLPESVAVPADPDVVIVRAGGDGERLDTALALMDRQVGPPADLLLLSAPPGADERIEDRCGTATETYAVACFEPDPVTTAGEAQAIGALEPGLAWERIAVVTSTYHATRARQRIERCVDADVQMVAASPDLPVVDRALVSLRELAALGRDAFDGGEC
jgi:hypothetical protein